MMPYNLRPSTLHRLGDICLFQARNPAECTVDTRMASLLIPTVLFTRYSISDTMALLNAQNHVAPSRYFTSSISVVVLPVPAHAIRLRLPLPANPKSITALCCSLGSMFSPSGPSYQTPNR